MRTHMATAPCHPAGAFPARTQTGGSTAPTLQPGLWVCSSRPLWGPVGSRGGESWWPVEKMGQLDPAQQR